MDGLGKKLFAHAAFAQDQCSHGVAAGDFGQAQRLRHSRGRALDVREIVDCLAASDAPRQSVHALAGAQGNAQASFGHGRSGKQTVQRCAVAQLQGTLPVADFLAKGGQLRSLCDRGDGRQGLPQHVFTHMKQALGISVDKPQRAACVKNQHGLAQQVRHGLQFLQQATQTHLFGDGLGCGYDQAKGVVVELVAFYRQGQPTHQRAVLAENRGCRAGPAVKAEIVVLTPKHAYCSLFLQAQAHSGGAVFVFTTAQPTQGAGCSTAKSGPGSQSMQKNALGIREDDAAF